jgi:ketosteroid isomerase-like protein
VRTVVTMDVDRAASNTAIALRLFAALDSNDRSGLESVLDPNGRWWTLTRRAARPMPEQLERFYDVCSQTIDGIRFRLGEMVADEAGVGVQVESRAEFPDGRVYENAYFWLLGIVDNRIAVIWEYYDTAYAAKFFGSPAALPAAG